MNAQFAKGLTQNQNAHMLELPQNTSQPIITRNQGRVLKTNQVTANKNQQLPTPIKIGPLTHWLEGHNEKNYITNGFTHGFSLNISGQPNHLSNHNHPSALSIADLVQEKEKINKEVTNWRTAGPFQSPPFLQFTTKKNQGNFASCIISLTQKTIL